MHWLGSELLMLLSSPMAAPPPEPAKSDKRVSKAAAAAKPPPKRKSVVGVSDAASATPPMEPLGLWRLPSEVTCSAFQLDGPLLVLGCGDGSVVLWDEQLPGDSRVSDTRIITFSSWYFWMWV